MTRVLTGPRPLMLVRPEPVPEPLSAEHAQAFVDTTTALAGAVSAHGAVPIDDLAALIARDKEHS